MKKIAIPLFLAVIMLVVPQVILAHDDTTVIRLGSFLAGFTHPVLGLDHFLAMLSVGIISAQIGGRAIWLVPLTFVVVMAAGGVVGLAGFGLTAIEAGIASSVLVLGIAIAAEKSIPVAVGLLAVSLFAIFHGYAHGAEMPSMANPVRYALGFLSGTAVIHIIGVILGDIPTHYDASKTIFRVLGSAIAFVGILFLIGII